MKITSNIPFLFAVMLCFSILFFSLIPFLVSAQVLQINDGTAPKCPPGKLCNPIGSSTLDQFIVKITAAALKVGVPIAALFIIWSGFLFVTAQGSEEKIKKAKEIFLWTIIGTAVLLAASTLAFVLTETIKQVKL